MIKNERQYKYTCSKLQELKMDLEQIKEQYKDDEQGLKLFSHGYIEHISQLQKDIDTYEEMQNKPLPKEFIIRSLSQINKYLVQLRLGRNITQTRLAKLVKCKQSDISRLERDNYNKFSLNTLLKIVNALGSKIEIRIINKKIKEQSNPFTLENFYLKYNTDDELKLNHGVPTALDELKLNHGVPTALDDSGRSNNIEDLNAA
jgi:transcriptional regulator with XRE-family HTH domain